MNRPLVKLQISASDGKSVLERASIAHIEQGSLHRFALGICIALGLARLGTAPRRVE
jgi:hypothetical protein